MTSKNLLFVSGKGGVGKTVVSQAIALRLSRKGLRTLWVAFEDPLRPAGELRQAGPSLWHLNCDSTLAFEEYAALKIGMPALARVFLQNKLMRYLAKAAPGIHELVLLGKVWHDRTRYDHVVVDMPSTGYGLAMFQSVRNFRDLFKGGPLFRDAEEMLATFHDPKLTSHLIVSLPEEMPLRESLELEEFLRDVFPENRAEFWVNRRFPHVATREQARKDPPDLWPTPFARTASEYCYKRSVLEHQNLDLWRDRGIEFREIAMIAPDPEQTQASVATGIADQLQREGIL